MIASELLMLNISNAGETVTRFTLKFLDTLISSCVMRSPNVAPVGTMLTVIDAGWNDDGRITAPAGHGAGQLAGYRVDPRLIVITSLLFGAWLLWNAAL